MITSGVLIILGLAIVGVLLSTISARRGLASGYVAVSWIPLAALLGAFPFRHRLGLAALGILGAIMMASLLLLGLGVAVSSRTRRERASKVSRLVVATILAGAPLVLVALALLHARLH